MFPTQVTLVEVGPRDGLQNEAAPVSTAHKIELVHRLQASGLKEIEVTSFVSPKWVPQMADNAEVLAGIRRAPGVRYSVLTPNMKGLEGALGGDAGGAEAGAGGEESARRPDEVVVFAAASEAFSRRNINCSIAESVERFRPVVEAAHAAGLKVRGAISCALGCPYQGEVTADEVENVVRLMKAIGVDHCGVADTIGVGTPRAVRAAMERALKHYPLVEVSGHFHDTYGQALANIYACLEMGVHTFDASVAGLGGCPYAKGATGNVATEDVLFMLQGMGIATGVDLDRLVDAGAFISGVLGRAPASRTGRALLARRAVAAELAAANAAAPSGAAR
ncbi:MAG: hydroxymethylglutaryl-CoA lyase [Burkholderiales bacterium]|nr:hydroxymethylglutaryl-CoA lyase [Burkholderiales bacterium]